MTKSKSHLVMNFRDAENFMQLRKTNWCFVNVFFTNGSAQINETFPRHRSLRVTCGQVLDAVKLRFNVSLERS